MALPRRPSELAVLGCVATKTTAAPEAQYSCRSFDQNLAKHIPGSRLDQPGGRTSSIHPAQPPSGMSANIRTFRLPASTLSVPFPVPLRPSPFAPIPPTVSDCASYTIDSPDANSACVLQKILPRPNFKHETTFPCPRERLRLNPKLVIKNTIPQNPESLSP